MSPLTIALLLLLLLLLGAMFSFIHLRPLAGKLPPGPWPLPIIGNLHMLGNLPHRNLRDLAKKYGPIICIRLGNVPTIVVSSPDVAKLFLKTHDTVFASHPKTQASEYLTYGSNGMVFSEYGPYWRNVRRLCTEELLSRKKIESFAAVRREEIGLMVQSLKEVGEARQVVDLSDCVTDVVEHMTHRMIFGGIKIESLQLKGLIKEASNLTGAFDLADYVPFLGALDLQGHQHRLKTLNKDIDQVLKKIIDEHWQYLDVVQKDPTDHMNFIEVMVSLMKSQNCNNYKIEHANIKAVILELLIGSIETSATAIEWILSELLRHPKVMRRLQKELENVIGTERAIEEIDLSKLTYLDMVVKEGLRLHPVAPFLIARESTENITINGYNVPKRSRILINTWAIGRDAKVWSDNAGEFLPERFIGNNIDVRGHDFQLTPFGSGRRKCPGMELGLINVQYIVGQLVHCFEWELPNRMSPNDLDMSEKFGLSLPRANHLLAIPTYRLCTF